MNSKNQTNLSQSENMKDKGKKRNFPGLYAYQNVLLYTYLQHKPTLTHT